MMFGLFRTTVSHVEKIVKDSIDGIPDLTVRVPADLQEVPPSALPGWWTKRRNVVFSVGEIEKFPVTIHHGQEAPRNSILVLGKDCTLGGIVMWGEGSVVVLGDNVRFKNSTIACGGGARVLIGGDTACTARAHVNARNGGRIIIGEQGLWAPDVGLYTDDMHAIRDLATGQRLNGMGGRIVVSDHVWLTYQSLLLGNVSIGRDSVIGARSVVRGAIPSNCVAVGQPARVVRQGITWDFNDLP